MFIISTLAKFIIRTYQLLLSPVLGVNCRFTPTCSHYAIEAIDKHGSAKGIILACKRLLRCHPFADAGCDPVPPVKSNTINSNLKLNHE